MMFAFLFTLAHAAEKAGAAAAPAVPAGTPAGAATVPPAGGGMMLGGMLPLILIMVAFFFLIIWPQQRAQKKHQNLLKELKKGDKVLMRSGIYGVIAAIEDNDLTVRIANNVEIKVVRSVVETVVKPAESTPQ